MPAMLRERALSRSRMPKPGNGAREAGCTGGGISKRGMGCAIGADGGGSIRDLSVTGPAGNGSSSTGTGIGVGGRSGAAS